jgi:hypothetical protein
LFPSTMKLAKACSYAPKPMALCFPTTSNHGGPAWKEQNLESGTSSFYF